MIGIKDYPVGIYNVSSSTRLVVEPIPTKIICYEQKDPHPSALRDYVLVVNNVSSRITAVPSREFVRVVGGRV